MPGQFGEQIKAFGDKSTRRATLVVRKAAIEIFRRVILRTPVDTGRARGNWQAATGSAPTAVFESAADPTGGAALNGAIGVALAWQPAEGLSLFLANNLPYIERLENGWSGQAPAGMVAITLSEFEAMVEGAAREVGDAG